MRAAAPLVGAMLLAGCSEVGVKCCDVVAVRLMSDVCLGDVTACSIIELEKQLDLLRSMERSTLDTSTEQFCIRASARVAGSPELELPAAEACDPVTGIHEQIASRETELRRLQALQAQRLN